jgi:hypothetical protein
MTGDVHDHRCDGPRVTATSGCICVLRSQSLFIGNMLPVIINSALVTAPAQLTQVCYPLFG